MLSERSCSFLSLDNLLLLWVSPEIVYLSFLFALLQVVANIPFNISTDVVKQLLPMGDIFSEVVLLLQVGIILLIDD